MYTNKCHQENLLIYCILYTVCIFIRIKYTDIFLVIFHFSLLLKIFFILFLCLSFEGNFYYAFCFFKYKLYSKFAVQNYILHVRCLCLNMYNMYLCKLFIYKLQILYNIEFFIFIKKINLRKFANVFLFFLQ